MLPAATSPGPASSARSGRNDPGTPEGRGVPGVPHGLGTPGGPGTRGDAGFPGGLGTPGGGLSSGGYGWPGLSGSVNLTMPLTAWLGLSDQPGEAAGLGALDAGTCRDLADMLARQPLPAGA